MGHTKLKIFRISFYFQIICKFAHKFQNLHSLDKLVCTDHFKKNSVSQIIVCINEIFVEFRINFISKITKSNEN